MTPGSGGPRPAEDHAVLFVCTGNAGRSQMAQALLRQRVGDAVRAESAGVAPWPCLHPVAVRLLNARGVDLTGHCPKPVAAIDPTQFDHVVTLGGPAHDRLPRAAFGAAYWEHWDVADPADADGTPGSEAAFGCALADIEERLAGLEPRRMAPAIA